MEVSGLRLFQCTILACVQNDWDKLQITSVRTVSVLAQISTQHLLNINQKCNCLSEDAWLFSFKKRNSATDELNIFQIKLNLKITLSIKWEVTLAWSSVHKYLNIINCKLFFTRKFYQARWYNSNILDLHFGCAQFQSQLLHQLFWLRWSAAALTSSS
jgi:hypothetical protein